MCSLFSAHRNWSKLADIEVTLLPAQVECHTDGYAEVVQRQLGS